MDGEAFSAYVDKAMQDGQLKFIRPVVEKELLHYEIFAAMDGAGLLKHLVFQGGTSLRLCYGSQRFSEDLDFAGGRDFCSDSMAEIKDCVVSRIGKRFGLAVSVREPKKDKTHGLVQVNKWMLAIETSPGRADLPRQRIKLEIANVPAYTREVFPLRINYPVLEGRHQPLVVVESMDEILADKLVALPSSISRRTDTGMEFTPTRIRHRDIWDMSWLATQGAVVDADMVRKKVADYGLADFPDYLGRAITAIPIISSGGPFRDQMARFLPQDQHAQMFGIAGYEKHFERTVLGQLSVLRDLLKKEAVRDHHASMRGKGGPEL